MFVSCLADISVAFNRMWYARGNTCVMSLILICLVIFNSKKRTCTGDSITETSNVSLHSDISASFVFQAVYCDRQS